MRLALGLPPQQSSVGAQGASDGARPRGARLPTEQSPARRPGAVSGVAGDRRIRCRSGSDEPGVSDGDGHTCWELLPLDSDTFALWNMVRNQLSLVTKQRWESFAFEAARMGAVGKKSAKAGVRRELDAWDEILEGVASKGHGYVNAGGTDHGDLYDVPAAGFAAAMALLDEAVQLRGSL